MTFFVIFIIYEFIFSRDYRNGIKLKKNAKKQVKQRKKPVEIRLLESYYKVEIDKLSYTRLLNAVALVSSLDIAIIVTVACISKIGLIQILIALILVVPIIYSSYYLLAKYYKRKIRKKEAKNQDKVNKEDSYPDINKLDTKNTSNKSKKVNKKGRK